MGLYPKIPYVIGRETSVLQYNRVSDKKVYVRRALPGNIIVIHGVNDVGTSYQAVEDGLCAGLCTRLGRGFTAASYRMPETADQDRAEPDPDAIFFKRKIVEATNSPVIPFYWGFREISGKQRLVNGQFTDRHGTRLDKDLSKGGGPFINATSSLPDMWNRGVYAPLDAGGDPLRPLKTAPGRMYMVLAAKRLAALISMIRDYDANETVSVAAHSQGCMLTLLAQAMLMEQGLAPADTLILTHPPYSLEDDLPILVGVLELFSGGDDAVMKAHYGKLDGRQCMGARLQTLVNIVAGVAKRADAPRLPAFEGLDNNLEHFGMVGSNWKAVADRDNRGKVYLYFSPEDMTVALENMQGIGWQGVPDVIDGTVIKYEQELVYDIATTRRAGPFHPHPRDASRKALSELGPAFHQRVFSAKLRPDPRTGKMGPVPVGLPRHDFVLRMKGEDDFAHVEVSDRSLRVHHKVAQWPIDTKNKWSEQRVGIRTINGEALREPVMADLVGTGQIEAKNLPRGSSHARLKPRDQGPCEMVDPIDAATAVANESLALRLVEQPDPGGGRSSDESGLPEELPFESTRKMAEQYNADKHLKGTDAQRTVDSAYRLKDGRVVAQMHESPDEARIRWQHEVSAKSFHGGIIGSAKNHEHVTAYDVAIGAGTASSDPAFYAYLCAVADWRLKKPLPDDASRPGILLWNDFRSKYKVYWEKEPNWRGKIIQGNADYYSNGILPICLPLPSGPLWSIVVSELTSGKHIDGKDKP
ncbi:MAG: DUF3274 domain-containing protein [Pseudomonadota bacterium]